MLLPHFSTRQRASSRQYFGKFTLRLEISSMIFSASSIMAAPESAYAVKLRTLINSERLPLGVRVFHISRTMPMPP